MFSFKRFLAAAAAVFGLAGAASAQTVSYTVDDLLPDPYSAFVTLRAGQFNISNMHFDPRTGTAGLAFPLSIDYLGAGSSVRLKVLVPPGVNLVTWRAEAANLVAFFGACDSNGTTCHDESYTPTLYPYNYNGQSPTATPVDQLPALTTPKIVYLTVKTQSIDFDFLSLTVNYNVKDAAAYEAWRVQRNWAGGSGDCDGLGGVYCGAPTTGGGGTVVTTPPVNTPTTTVTPLTLFGFSTEVSSGASYSLASSVSLASCTATSTGSGVAPPPSINGTLVNGTAPTLTASEATAQLTVACTGTGGEKGSTVLTVKAAPGAATTLEGVANVATDGKVTLSAKFTPANAVAGQVVTFWLGAEVTAFGWTVTPTVFTKNQAGTWEQFSILSMLGDNNAIQKRVPFTAGGVTVPLLAGEFSETDLKTMKTKVYGAYRIDNGPIVTFPAPFYDCSGTSCKLQ